MAAELLVVRVFCDPRGRAGNRLGVFLDDPPIPPKARQGIARELAFSETVFVDDATCGRLEIFTPSRELPFAGHPLVGAAWLLSGLNKDLSTLNPPAGQVPLRREDGLTWIRARADYSPDWELVQLPSADAVAGLHGAPRGLGHVQAWAWEDEQIGRVRARVFAEDYGVPEDPATGSAAVVLCRELGRDLCIHQGPGDNLSEILVRAAREDWVELGGLVVNDRPPAPFEIEL